MRIQDLLEETRTEDNFMDIMTAFLPVAMKELDVDQLPKIKLVFNVPDTEQPTFGKFENDKNLIWLAIENRHPLDIVRTLAHELVHYKQHILGHLGPHSGDTGSPEENEAHAVAGVIMRHFNKANPQYFEQIPISI